MANKLYTTYTHKIKDIPEDCSVAVIMRYPFFITDEAMKHVPQLSPKDSILKEYKKTGDWAKFEEDFKNQMYTDPETMDYIEFLMDALKDNSVCLVCCEKDNSVCHRRLIGEYLKDLGYKWEELK